jgi:hypothetical protein
MKFVYLAAPVPMHGTKKYAEAQLRIAAYFPDHALIVGVFHTAKAWLDQWPELQLVPNIGVVLRAKDDSVGRGTYREITDLQDRGRSCYLLNEAGQFILLERAPFDLIDGGRDWRRFAMLQPSHAKQLGLV